MALLGDLDHVRSMMRPNETTSYGSDIDARLALIRQLISAGIESELGRTFGTAVPDTTQIVWAGASDQLLFDRPARAVTSVTTGGTVVGGTVTAGTLYASDLWTFAPYDSGRGLIYGLRLLSGGWWGGTTFWGHPATPVVVVGDFSDTDDDTAVPAEITYIANLLILRTFQRENTGVAGVSGEDGSFQPPLNPWKDPNVMRVLDQYRISTREFVV